MQERPPAGVKTPLGVPALWGFPGSGVAGSSGLPVPSCQGAEGFGQGSVCAPAGFHVWKPGAGKLGPGGIGQAGSAQGTQRIKHGLSASIYDLGPELCQQDRL